MPLIRIGEWKDGYIEMVAICSVDSYVRMGEVRKELVKRIHAVCTTENIRLHNPLRRPLP